MFPTFISPKDTKGHHLTEVFHLPTCSCNLEPDVNSRGRITKDIRSVECVAGTPAHPKARIWLDDSVNFFRVYIAPPAQVPDVRRRILERYAGQRQVFVLNNDELKRYILRISNQWLGLTYIQVAVAVLVAIFGIVNTLTVSITDRRREFGVLRAVGGLNGQIRRTIWMEALSIGAIGIALGFGLGAINLYYVLEIVRQDIVGMRLEYQFPATVALTVVPMMFAAAFLAAIWPAESAVRRSLVEALEYE